MELCSLFILKAILSSLIHTIYALSSCITQQSQMEMQKAKLQNVPPSSLERFTLILISAFALDKAAVYDCRMHGICVQVYVFERETFIKQHEKGVLRIPASESVAATRVSLVKSEKQRHCNVGWCRVIHRKLANHFFFHIQISLAFSL